MPEDRLKAARSPRRWIWIALAVAVHAWVLWAALGWTLSSHNAVPHWEDFPTSRIFHNATVRAQPDFFDSDVLLYGAERIQAGEDPLSPRLFGDSGFYYNYPPGWRILAFLRLHRSEDLAALGWIFGALFSVSLFWILPPTSGRVFLLHAVIVASPPILNTLAEANGEILVLALVTASAKLALRSGLLAEIVSLLSLAFASTLKLYPAVGFGVLAFCRGRLRWMAFVAGAIVAAWFLTIAPEIKVVIERTPRPFANAFGCEIIQARAANLLASHSHWIASFPQLAVLAGIIAHAGIAFRAAYLIVVAAGFACGRRALRPEPALRCPAVDVPMAMGAALFVGAFGIGNSWSHRLLVLILCIGAAAQGKGRGLLLLLLLATLWSSYLTGGVTFIAEQALLWTMVFILSREVGKQA